MTVYRFRKKILLEKGIDKIPSDILADIVDRAEENAYKKLIEEVSRHYIGFIVDSSLVSIKKEGKIIGIVVDLYLDLDISPLSEKVAYQDKIAEEIANAYFEAIREGIDKFFKQAS